MANRTFQNVGGLRPGKSFFPLTYEKKFDCDFGQLIPVMMDEMVPGDVFKMSNRAIVRMQPLVAPVMHEINIFVHYFFVPYRILWEGWEEFISGGEDGNSLITQPEWIPENNGLYSLWDYIGFPPDVDPVGAYPVDYPRRAYNTIWNEYYRDQNLQDEVDLDNEDILNRSWMKDYFTSALPFQQRGVAPALPVSGTLPVQGLGWDADFYNQMYFDKTSGNKGAIYARDTNNNLYNKDSNSNYVPWYGRSKISKNDLNPGVQTGFVDLQGAATFDVSDLRLAFQVQKWMERNARAGVRYTEFLQSHFGVHPRDDRLQRPEYVGGTRAPVIVSEVLQTSETGSSPQGNMAGHGLSANTDRVSTYRAVEYGVMVGLMSIMPKPSYQQGINRQWLRKVNIDYYFPEYAHLSEQQVMTAEIYATNDGNQNVENFGYQGRYNEMRYKPNMVAGSLRGELDYWHLGRKFANRPMLNASFIECDATKDDLKRIFAVQNRPGFIVNYANIINAYRPLPVLAEPGLIDHF